MGIKLGMKPSNFTEESREQVEEMEEKEIPEEVRSEPEPVLVPAKPPERT